MPFPKGCAARLVPATPPGSEVFRQRLRQPAISPSIYWISSSEKGPFRRLSQEFSGYADLRLLARRPERFPTRRTFGNQEIRGYQISILSKAGEPGAWTGGRSRGSTRQTRVSSRALPVSAEPSGHLPAGVISGVRQSRKVDRLARKFPRDHFLDGR